MSSKTGIKLECNLQVKLVLCCVLIKYSVNETTSSRPIAGKLRLCSTMYLNIDLVVFPRFLFQASLCITSINGYSSYVNYYNFLLI